MCPKCLADPTRKQKKKYRVEMKHHHKMDVPSMVIEENPFDHDLLQSLMDHLSLGSWLADVKSRNSGKQLAFKQCFGVDAANVSHFC